MSKHLITAIFVAALLGSCQPASEKQSPLFRLLSSKSTGITFANHLEETHEMNVIEYQDFYSGGGVSIGDIDNDGLADIFFTGNQVPARLYKNKGEMVFEDITSRAGLDHMGRGWYTGTTMIDLNNDGFLDIYISKSGMEAPDDRANLLYINDGTGRFTEQARAFGLNHKGFAVNAAFFDYDRDGDLDMYLVNQGPVKITSGDATALRHTPHHEAGDVLYEQIEGKFVDVSAKAGLHSSVIGFAHGVSVGDINNDGWDDIFVSNDFFEYDYLYLNNQNKTFTESIKKSMPHISYYSMGNDMADYNNDGLTDIVVVDMIAEGNRRLYANLGGMNANKFQNHLSNGLHYQYMFNMLHLNYGKDNFGEVGTMAGISRTDWSWAPLFADFDNDGWKDLYVTNGIRKDIRNMDWGDMYRQYLQMSGGKNIFSDAQWNMLLKAMPSEPVVNYMFEQGRPHL
ncbi:MAG: VCBS repeat-containing protein [Cyclobacteriaceae bacterium]|nr:VCBS repeat-containing protein [Cyclobacteriaceae bacterium]